MAGLLDQYTLGGNSQALQMVVWMAEYFENRVKNVIQKYSIERHWVSLNDETGGMNDVLYRLYSITVNFFHFYTISVCVCVSVTGYIKWVVL